MNANGRLTLASLMSLSAGAAGLSTLAVSLDLHASQIAWLLDLLVHWQWLYLLCSLFCGAWLVWLDRRVWLLAVLAAGVCIACVLRAAPALPTLASQDRELKVVSANLYYRNAESQGFIDWLEAQAADVVFLQEVSTEILPKLRQLDQFQSFVFDADSTHFTMVVLARYPVHSIEFMDSNQDLPDQRRTYRLRMRWLDQEVALAPVHLAAPTRPHHRRDRDRLLLETARWAARSDVPVIVAGDINATPWSHAFRDAATIGLRRASGLAPTWPTVFELTPAIPIDHVLASHHWSSVSSQRGPYVGSDHLPILVTLSLQPESRWPRTGHAFKPNVSAVSRPR